MVMVSSPLTVTSVRFTKYVDPAKVFSPLIPNLIWRVPVPPVIPAMIRSKTWRLQAPSPVDKSLFARTTRPDSSQFTISSEPTEELNDAHSTASLKIAVKNGAIPPKTLCKVVLFNLMRQDNSALQHKL